MATTVNLRKILDRKQWEMVNNLPATPATGSTFIQSEGPDQQVMYVASSTSVYLYDPNEDAYVLLPTPSFANGTFGTGVCGAYHTNGPTGTATGGSTTTLNSAVTTVGSLAGYTIRITGGTGAGQDRVIASNTVGTNATFTVSSAFTTAPDSTSTYLLLTGRYYVFLPGATTPGFKYYDVATNTWSAALSITGAPTGAAADLAMKTTCGYLASFSTGTVNTGTSTTLVSSSKTWATNQWVNFQVRINGTNTATGQVRTITANDATSLTVSGWSATPSSANTFTIEGNDDFIYLTGNASTAIYRYSISGNTWSTLSGARASAAGAGGVSLNWVRSSTNTTWTNESAIINGRRLYSFRGGATGNLDYYDIPTNTWTSLLTSYQYGGSETVTTGTAFENGSNGLIYLQKDATGRFFKFDCMANALLPWSLLPFTQGTATVGNKAFSVKYTDGATTLTYIYFVINSSAIAFRCLVI